MTGSQRIARERERQIAEEGWAPEHDDGHDEGELARAAACYASPEPIFVRREAESAFFSGNDGGRGDRALQPEGYYDAWPWDPSWWKSNREGGAQARIRDLEKAGALIAAEIDRLLRLDGEKPHWQSSDVNSPDWFEATG